MVKSKLYLLGALFLVCWGRIPIAVADTAAPNLNAQCEARAPGPADERKFTCTFAVFGTDQRYVFKARFLGSHDDTALSMTATLNQRRLTCEPGSKTSSRFEDGEISLECRFSANGGANSQQVLEIDIEWSHAQYADFEFAKFIAAK